MKIVIIDERSGNMLRDDARDAVAEADIVGFIEQDGHVRMTKPNDRTAPVWITFFDGVHRDVISGEESAEARDERTRARIEAEQAHAMPIEDKIANGLREEGHHGTEKLGG